MTEYALKVKCENEEAKEYRFFDYDKALKEMMWQAKYCNPVCVKLQRVEHDEYGEEIEWEW